jgi:nucleotide-binding universal stress UspA family protein
MSARKLLVVVDDSPEFRAALRYACRRARNTGAVVTMLRVIQPSVFAHWTGAREEIDRELRAEAEALLGRLGAEATELSGEPPEVIIQSGDTRGAIRAVAAGDPDIKILVLAAAVGGRGPGPLVSSVAKAGVGFGRKLPVTVVPGDLTDEEIDALA